MLWLCHSESLVDRTDRVREKQSVIRQHSQRAMDGVMCEAEEVLPPWCTGEAGYLWKPRLMTGYPSYERWCTAAPYIEASAFNRNKQDECLVNKKKKVRENSTWTMIPPSPCVSVLSLLGLHLPLNPKGEEQYIFSMILTDAWSNFRYCMVTFEVTYPPFSYFSCQTQFTYMARWKLTRERQKSKQIIPLISHVAAHLV